MISLGSLYLVMHGARDPRRLTRGAERLVVPAAHSYNFDPPKNNSIFAEFEVAVNVHLVTLVISGLLSLP